MSRSADATCREFDERLDAYFDGELGELERARVDRHLTLCPACTETLAAFEDLRLGLHEALPREACPPAVTAAVLSLAEREHAMRPAPTPGLGARVRELLATLLPPPAWRPALVGGAVAVLLAVPLWRVLQGKTLSTPASETAELDPVELAQAEREARLVLAYVASIGENAGSKVRQEIMTHRIVEPARRAFGFGTAGPARTER